ncbi:hypothetical protein ASPZODRAFT_127525 [Penicilliopsis zonata CBS 506.65]|uniref:Phenazine biosynthesis protein n=1 Tax=Penicilliopsis zonata CBS 506.65 TaxID=1073090 RepID=A0A1L9SWH6_9EURO|nr:hypothetical protein ASPZODRAFT_127525 [Penicilliopsis zonata CBS 506.65]OJJ51457.1 hypothetical protein ASPZODRAFT_127525 [Penicilliopsis zonata CBS 506.65]
MALRFVTLDVFTNQPYLGNPLGVVFLSKNTPITQAQKQRIAREFNLSETIFVHPRDESPPCSRRIDIFTTDEELPFAGHPTIGATSWFLEHSPDADDRANVHTLLTKAGPFSISRVPSAGEGAVAAKIAHNVHIHSARFALSELLRLHPSLEPFFPTTPPANAAEEVSFPVFSIVKGMSQVLVRLPSLEALAATQCPHGGEAIPCTAAAEGGYLDAGWESQGLVVIYFYVPDVYDSAIGKPVIRSRLFLRNFEDAATGSAASGLASYLALTEAAPGTSRYTVVQGVEMGRRSEIHVAIELGEDKRLESVELGGCAVQVSSGELVV